MAIREIVDEAKKGKSPVEKILKERQGEAETEYQEMKIRRLVEEEKARIRELKKQGLEIEPGLATDFTTHIFELAQVDPNKAKAFIESLDQESMNKMAYLMAMEKDRAGAFMQLAKSSGTDVKDLIEIMKFMRSNGGVDLKGISEIFNAGVNAARAQNPAGPATVQQGVDQIMKTYVNPFLDALKDKDKEIFEEKFKSLESKIVNPLEWFQQQKAVAGQLGFTPAGKSSEVDLKLEEMRQSHDLDMEKLRWEQNKFVMQQAAERDKWSAIQQMVSPIAALAGPEVRNQLKNLGRQVSKSMGPNPIPEGLPMSSGVAGFVCPSCNTELSIPLDKIPPGAEDVPIKCPKCGVVTPATFEKTEQKPPTEEKAKPNRIEAKYS